MNDQTHTHTPDCVKRPILSQGQLYCYSLYRIEQEVQIEVDEEVSIATCAGCGAYGQLGSTHTRNGEECGQYV